MSEPLLPGVRRWCKHCRIYWTGTRGDACFNCGRVPRHQDVIVAIILGDCPDAFGDPT